MNNDTIYPEPVIEISEKVFDTVFADKTFFEENEINDVELGIECADRCTKDFFLKKFVEGKSLTFSDEDEVLDFLSTVNAECCLRSLQKKGFLDSLYDPNKQDDVFFLTGMGKLAAEEMRRIEENESQ